MQTLHASTLSNLLVLLTLVAACSSGDGSTNEDAGSSPSDAAQDAGKSTADGGGDGGAWMNSAACPMQTPRAEASCTQVPLECRYGRDVCNCVRPAPGDPARWVCDDDDFGGPGASCPAAEPAPGGNCTPIRGECEYEVRACACSDATDTWACWNPADCPNAAPDERAACSTVGMQCEYETQGSDDLDCECASTGWTCDRQVCPAAKPTASAACEEGDGTCAFGEETCDCVDDAWLCWKKSDCPTTAPAPFSSCAILGITCAFADDVCECDDEGWDCD